MIKRYLLFLLIAVPVLAQDLRVDTLRWDDALVTTAGVITTNAIGWSDLIVDSIYWNGVPSKKKDTTRWYIELIGERCDTAYTKIWLPTKTPDVYEPFYERGIKCRVDTTWAEKVSVRLRPSELEKLMEIIAGL